MSALTISERIRRMDAPTVPVPAEVRAKALTFTLLSRAQAEVVRDRMILEVPWRAYVYGEELITEASDEEAALEGAYWILEERGWFDRKGERYPVTIVSPLCRGRRYIMSETGNSSFVEEEPWCPVCELAHPYKPGCM